MQSCIVFILQPGMNKFIPIHVWGPDANDGGQETDRIWGGHWASGCDGDAIQLRVMGKGSDMEEDHIYQR